MGEFDSQELQEAINEINEAQGQNTTELDAAMNGWEELAAMGRENSGAEAWSEGGDVGRRGDGAIFAGSDGWGDSV